MDNDSLITQEQVDQFQAALKPRQVSIDYAAHYNDNIILADTTNNNVAVTLPLAKNGKEFIVVKIAAGYTLTILFSGTDKMFGASNISVVDLGSSHRLKSVPGGYVPL